MIVVDKNGKYITVDENNPTSIKETPDGVVVSYNIIKDE